MKHGTSAVRVAKRRRQELILFFLVLLSATLYAAFRSISLDDFDSYSFALALDHFDLALQQPQPPGFPVYVFLGRGLRSLLGISTVDALVGLSALHGVLVTLVTFDLGRSLDPRHPFTAVAAATWVTLSPVAWLTAEKALSDTPGLLWTLLTLALLLRWSATPDRWIFPALTGLVAGLSLGVRPQNAVPILIGGAALAVKQLRSTKPLWPWAVAGVTGLCAVLLWWLPTAQATGGTAGYIAAIRNHAAHVGRADALLGMDQLLMAALRTRAWAFSDTFLTSTLGVTQALPWTWRETLSVLALVGLGGVGIARADWRRPETWLLLVWGLAVATQIFLFETLDRPRLMLPLLPPLALMIATGWARIKRPRWGRPLLMASSNLGLLLLSAPLTAQLATQAAPPVQATAYVAEQYAPATSLLAAAGSFRAVQVALPEYRLAYLYQFDPAAVEDTLDDNIHTVIIFDRDVFPQDAVVTLSAGGRYVPVADHTFTRDRRVHTQHDQVRVQVLSRADLVPANALVLPADGCIDVGGTEDGRYLAEGWFRPEEVGGVQARWAGGTMTSTIRVRLDADQPYRVHFRALAYPTEQTVTLYGDGHAIATQSLPQGWTEVVMSVPRGLLDARPVTTLALSHSRMRSPSDATGGTSSDTRALAAAYDWICITPSPVTPATPAP